MTPPDQVGGDIGGMACGFPARLRSAGIGENGRAGALVATEVGRGAFPEGPAREAGLGEAGLAAVGAALSGGGGRAIGPAEAVRPTEAIGPAEALGAAGSCRSGEAIPGSGALATAEAGTPLRAITALKTGGRAEGAVATLTATLAPPLAGSFAGSPTRPLGRARTGPISGAFRGTPGPFARALPGVLTPRLPIPTGAGRTKAGGTGTGTPPTGGAVAWTGATTVRPRVEATIGWGTHGRGGVDPSGAAGWLRRLEGIEQLGKPLRIAQKQPPQHRLKSRGLPIQGRIAAPGSAAGPVAATPHQIPLAIAQQGLEPGEGLRLGGGPHPPHHGPVQVLGAARAVALSAPLVQFPNGIPEPGELQGGQVG